MTLTDFVTTIAQLAILLFMVTMLALRKKLTTSPSAQPVEMHVHGQDVIERHNRDDYSV